MKRLIAALGFVLLFLGPAGVRVASAHIIVPASVKSGRNFNVRVRGFAGSYDAISVHAFLGSACAPTEAGQSNLIGGGQYSAVGPNQPFHFVAHFTARNPGRHEVCAYLYGSDNSDGAQVHAQRGYHVAKRPCIREPIIGCLPGTGP
jgi:hypothetical protein